MSRSLALRRMWINQPSTLQEHHKLHGTRVLAAPREGRFTQIYFTRGPCISMEIAEAALSVGWRPEPTGS